MDRRETALNGSMRLVWAPLVAFAAIGGATTMIGRSRSGRRGVKATTAARDVTEAKANKAIEAAQRALDEARQTLASRDGRRIQEEISRRAGTAVSATRETMPSTMKDASDRAREIADRVRVEGQARIPELTQRFRDDVAPKAKTYAQEAIDEAEGILATARQRATEVSKNARRDYGPEVSHKASALGGLIAAGSTAGYHVLRDRADQVARDRRGKRGKMAARGKGKASAALQTAGNQAKYVATESVMLTFWAGVLGAVIYFAILTREQRERVKGFFSNAFSQIQDIVTDYQSSDEGFQQVNR